MLFDLFLRDSGYPLRPTLLTLIVDTKPDSPQRYYTKMHCRLRNSVEKCIGVLKSRWRCLLVDRKLHYHPTTAGLITNACAVLHNLPNSARLPVEPLTPHEEHNERTQQVSYLNPKCLHNDYNTLVEFVYYFSFYTYLNKVLKQLSSLFQIVNSIRGDRDNNLMEGERIRSALVERLWASRQ